MPFNVVYGKVFLMADVGEVEHHRQAKKFVVPLADDGPAPSNDDLGEMVVQGDAGVAKGH